MYLKIFTLFILSILLYSCSKDNTVAPTNSTPTQKPDTSAPTLIFPANGDTLITSGSIFLWSKTNSSYKFQISCYPSFSQLLKETNLTDTTYGLTVTSYGSCDSTYTYYWRVGTVTNYYTWWSESTYHFTIRH